MKLNSTQVKQTLSQFPAEVLPDDHPANRPTEQSVRRSHLLYRCGGLKVLEPAGAPETRNPHRRTRQSRRLERCDAHEFEPHEPETTGVVVVLEATRH